MKARAFSLVEVMVALFIITVGALGFTKAQLAAVQSATEAGLRTTATLLVQDMVGRISANAGESLQGIAGGYYTGPATFNANCLAIDGNICTGNEMALHDLADWNTTITNSFPAGTGVFGLVCLDSIAGNSDQTCEDIGANPDPLIYTVKLFWESWNNRGTGTYDQFVVVTVGPPLER